MAAKKPNKLNREEATELYRDLRKAMSSIEQKKSTTPKGGDDMKDIAKSIAQSISKSMSKDKGKPVAPSVKSFAAAETEDAITRMQIDNTLERPGSGRLAAVVAVIVFALFKVSIGVSEHFGVITVEPVQASVQGMNPQTRRSFVGVSSGFSKEENRILTSLDARRAELEERSRKLDEKEMDMSRRDKEFVTKLAQLRDLTDSLKIDREKSEKKRNTQLEQLANVYGSMAPVEAAGLLEQLDISIALSLIEHMPEKRVGQILALMSPERALSMTRMLSGRSTGEKGDEK